MKRTQFRIYDEERYRGNAMTTRGFGFRPSQSSYFAKKAKRGSVEWMGECAVNCEYLNCIKVYRRILILNNIQLFYESDLHALRSCVRFDVVSYTQGLSVPPLHYESRSQFVYLASLRV